MKPGELKQLFNKCLADCGNDVNKANVKLGELFEKGLSSGSIKVEDIKLNEVAYDLLSPENFEALKREASMGATKEVALAVQSTAFPIIGRIAINKAIMDDYNLYSEDLSELYTEMQATKTDKEELAGFIEPEGPELRPENLSYEDTDLGEMNVTARMADFGRTISLTEEAIFNDVTGKLLEKARSLGQGAAQHMNKTIIQTLECKPRTNFKETTSNAFIYKNTPVADTTFFSADHTSFDGRVNKNLVTSNGLASYVNVVAAHKLFAKMKSLRGYDITVVPKVVVVHSDAEVAAWQIFNSTQFLQYGTEASKIVHNINPVGEGGIIKNRVKTIATRYLSAVDAWYYGDPKRQLKWLWVYKPKTDVLTENTEAAFYKKVVATYKFSYHAGAANTDYVYLIKNQA